MSPAVRPAGELRARRADLAPRRLRLAARGISRDPGALAEWYRRHLGWAFRYLADDDTYYAELYFRDVDDVEARQHLVYAIMPGDPGEPGRGHMVNYRVDDLEVIVASLRASGIKTSEITVGPDADGQGKFARLQDPEGHQVELWEHLIRQSDELGLVFGP